MGLYVNKCGGRSKRAKGTRPRSIFRTYIWHLAAPEAVAEPLEELDSGVVAE
jgi:hypothetical protein